jgi:oligopeptide/dipeptide ABC transporter ATP-binding protein
MNTSKPLLSVADLRLRIGRGEHAVDVVRGVNLTVEKGSTLAVVGESGSGKSLTALSMMGLLPTGVAVSGGEILFDGQPVVGLSERQWQPLRGKEIAMIFQDPLSALNPCVRVGDQVGEVFRRRAGLSRREARQRAVAAMAEVGIPDAERRASSYPHEFSGGMRQRVMIAMALALDPQLLIADEPTTALDVTVQAQVMRLLRARKQAANLTLVLISHDLGVVSKAADSVAVMYSGRIVETGPSQAIFSAPAHPYTHGLMRAVPDRRRPRAALEAIPGQPPDPRAIPAGCPFHPRCPIARDICRTQDPPLRPAGPQRMSACHFAEEVIDHGVAAAQPTGTVHHG